MALFYKPRQAAIADKNGDKKWHLSLVKTGKIVGVQELSEEVSYSSTLTPADIHASIRGLFRVVRTHLLNSNSVRLDGLGTFTMVARTTGTGVDTPKEVNPEQITSLRVHFTPEYTRPIGKTTRAILEGVEFIRADKINSNYKGSDDAGNGDDDDDFVDPTL